MKTLFVMLVIGLCFATALGVPTASAGVYETAEKVVDKAQLTARAQYEWVCSNPAQPCIV